MPDNSPSANSADGGPRRPRSTRRAVLITLAAVATAAPVLTVVRSTRAQPAGPARPPSLDGPEPVIPPAPSASPEPPFPTPPRQAHPRPSPSTPAPAASSARTGSPSASVIVDSTDGPLLSIEQDGAGTAIYATKPGDVRDVMRLDAYGSALTVRQTQDWQGQVMDLSTFVHRSTGDAIFIEHRGGMPPSSTGPAGGVAGVSVQMPYYLDAVGGDGRNGSQVNDRTGMSAFNVDVQPTNVDVDGIRILYSGGYSPSTGRGSALTIMSQPAVTPQGTGRAITVYHAGSSDAVVINNYGPGAGLRLFSGNANAYPIFVHDGTGQTLMSLDSRGQLGARYGFMARDMPATNSPALSTYAKGDGTFRWVVTADGHQVWGPGNAGFDVHLFRPYAGALRYTGALEASTDSAAQGIALRTRAAQLWQFLLQTDGKMQWGSGGPAPDTTLERSAAGVLRLTDSRLGYSDSQTTTAIGPPGTAAPLPALPDGYLLIDVGGTPKKVPYFSADAAPPAPTASATPTGIPTATATATATGATVPVRGVPRR